MTYAKTVEEILKLAINQPHINMVGEGSVYDLNNIQDSEFPVFWVSSTKPHNDRNDYMVFNLTFMYIDREREQDPTYIDSNRLLIESNGIQAMRNIIHKIEDIEGVIEVDSDVNYTVFNDTEVFSWKCAGIYTDVAVTVETEHLC